MIARTELAIICRRLTTELREVGFIFDDFQFDESGQTLCIILDKAPEKQIYPSSCSEAAIDARLLWDLLKDLARLGFTSPAIKFRFVNQDERATRRFREGSDSRGA
jgi:hypothetical protein